MTLLQLIEIRFIKDEAYRAGTVGLVPVNEVLNQIEADFKLRSEPIGRRILVCVEGDADVRSAVHFISCLELDPESLDKLKKKSAGRLAGKLSYILRLIILKIKKLSTNIVIWIGIMI